MTALGGVHPDRLSPGKSSCQVGGCMVTANPCLSPRTSPPGRNAAHPGMPPASILLATVTSVDHTSYCQRFWPRTPPSTVPVCTPTRMSTPVFVFSRTYLPGTRGEEGGSGLAVAR